MMIFDNLLPGLSIRSGSSLLPSDSIDDWNRNKTWHWKVDPCLSEKYSFGLRYLFRA